MELFLGPKRIILYSALSAFAASARSRKSAFRGKNGHKFLLDPGSFASWKSLTNSTIVGFVITIEKISSISSAERRMQPSLSYLPILLRIFDQADQFRIFNPGSPEGHILWQLQYTLRALFQTESSGCQRPGSSPSFRPGKNP